MERVVADGREPGLLAYDDDGAAIGWVAIAPREETPLIARSPQYGPRGDETGIWSITCFVVDTPVRREGADYMGGIELFLRAGFVKVRDANKRAIVRAER